MLIYPSLKLYILIYCWPKQWQIVMKKHRQTGHQEAASAVAVVFSVLPALPPFLGLTVGSRRQDQWFSSHCLQESQLWRAHIDSTSFPHSLECIWPHCHSHVPSSEDRSTDSRLIRILQPQCLSVFVPPLSRPWGNPGISAALSGRIVNDQQQALCQQSDQTRKRLS